MAVVTPVSGNNCKGTFVDGTPDVRLKCVRSVAEDGSPVFTCATKRFFLVSCPPGNQQCSNLSGAWVAACTVCSQRLF